MQEVFVVLKNSGASFSTAQEFGNVLHTYVSQNDVRNGIWDACVESLR